MAAQALPQTDREQFRETLARWAEKTKARIPALNGRIEKAVRLALAGDVELHSDGNATVYSSSDPTKRYAIINSTCTCRDYEQAPEHLCQHRLSAGLLRRTYELLHQPPVPVVPEDLPEPWPDNDPEEPPPAPPAPPAPPPLPEAPCSVNVRLVIDRRDCQLTLRDTDEERLLQRLAAVLAQYPVAEPPVRSEGWCSKHGVQMQRRENAKGVWYSHYIDGVHCKGR